MFLPILLNLSYKNISFAVGMVGLEPTLLTEPDPKSGAATNYATSRKKHSNDFRSHVCKVLSIDLSLYPLATKEPYPYSCTLVSIHLMKLFYSTTQLDMLLCGSGRIRTYSALRQQIYSLSRLSNCGALPYIYGKRSQLSLHFTCFVVARKTTVGCFLTSKNHSLRW